MHQLPLVTTLAAGFFSAWVLGIITHRLGLSPLVGYIVAGILIGPHTPGFVGDIRIAGELAEIGVILLMFGVGLHFHFSDLNRVKWIAIPGAVGQSAVATLLGLVAFSYFGFKPSAAVVLGMALAVASTVVLIKVLQENDKLHTRSGHVAVGWLIVEDLFTIVVLVLLPIIASSAGAGTASSVWTALLTAFLKLAGLIGLVVLAGVRIVPRIMVWVAAQRSRELFTLTVLVLSVAVAAASYLFFGASLALGAFLGGMVVGQSPVSHQAASDALPLRDAFAVLFFVSVGMLFDFNAFLAEPLMVLAALAIVLVAKPLAALVIVAVLGHPFRTGITAALSLAQIGEFSFILSELARRQGLMPDVGHTVLVAAAIISISLNPLLFRLRGPIENAVRNRRWLWGILNGRAERRIGSENVAATEKAAAFSVAGNTPLAVVVGYGIVGQALCQMLRKSGIRTIVIESNVGTVARIRETADEGLVAIYGDASSRLVLEEAGVRKARYFVVTMAMSSNPAPVVALARGLNPDLRIYVRSRYLGDREALLQAGADLVVFEEAEVAIAMGRMMLQDFGVAPEKFEQEMAGVGEYRPG